MEENPFLNPDLDLQTRVDNEGNQPENGYAPIPIWKWIKLAIVGFLLMIFYIYNSHHATKALRNKERCIKELKNLHSKRISLESETSNSLKQSELSKRFQVIGLKEITTPPIKIVKPREQD
ncbi:MAG: hypothetical protein CK532_07550 [Flavobacteriales bacterium]|nr:MAG: hypothetical protein CK532_07550 [Flavobacteriales bacterium]